MSNYSIPVSIPRQYRSPVRRPRQDIVFTGGDDFRLEIEVFEDDALETRMNVSGAMVTASLTEDRAGGVLVIEVPGGVVDGVGGRLDIPFAPEDTIDFAGRYLLSVNISIGGASFALFTGFAHISPGLLIDVPTEDITPPGGGPLDSPVVIGTPTRAATALLQFFNTGFDERGIEWYSGDVRRAGLFLSNIAGQQVIRQRMYDADGGAPFTMLDMRYNAGTIAAPHVINIGPNATASQRINLDTRGDVKAFTFTASPSALGPLSGATNPPNTATFKTTYSGTSRSSLIKTVSIGSNADSLALRNPNSLDYLEVTGQLLSGFDGSRVGIRSTIITAPTTLSNDSRAFTPFSGSVQLHGNLGGVAKGFGTRHFGSGTGFGIFYKSVVNSDATFILANVGGEINVTTEAGGSAYNQVGLQLVHEATNAVKPLRQNVGFLVGDQGGASVLAAWEGAFVSGEYGAQWAVHPDGTVYGARTGYNYGTVPSNVALGVDMLEINTTGAGRTGGGAAYRWQGGRVIPGTDGGSVQVGAAALSGTATGALIDLTYAKSTAIAVGATPGVGYAQGDLFGVPLAGAIGRVDSVVTKAITGATATNPVVISSPAHGLANGIEVDIADVVGMTQLNRLLITGISQDNPGVIQCPGHGLADGAPVRLSGVLGMSQINGTPYHLIANRTPDTFTLTYVNGVPVDTSNYSPYTSGGIITLPCLVANATAGTFTLTDIEGGPINGSAYSAYVSGGTVVTGIPDAVSIHRAGWQVAGPTTNVATANLTRGLINGSGLTVNLTWTPQNGLTLLSAGKRLGIFGANPIVKQTVSGSRGGNAALASLIAAVAAYGLVVDSTTA